jgi:hypothetical protein
MFEVSEDRRPAGQRGPWSLFQEQLYYLDQLSASPAHPSPYHANAAIRFRGQLGVQLLERAVNQVIARHEGLRAGLVEVDGGRRLWVASEVTLPLPVVDLRSLSGSIPLAPRCCTGPCSGWLMMRRCSCR